MRVVVSACLMGENCKYNGGNNYSEAVAAHLRTLPDSTEVLSVCPEILGGLPCPRAPAELVDGVVRTADGSSVDEAFRRGAARALAIAQQGGVTPDLCIVQPRSPSCGLHEVYNGSFTGVKVPGSGVFADALKAAGLPVAEPDELPIPAATPSRDENI